MARRKPERYGIIYDYVNQYYAEHSRYPSVRDIAAGTGISLATVHRYLKDMKESGEIEYDGRRSISTSQIEMDSPTHFMKVLGYVACGEGQEEEESVIEYIRMPESIVGKGEFFALIAKGESMIGAGISPGDYVIVRLQRKMGSIFSVPVMRIKSHIPISIQKIYRSRESRYALPTS